ncbi:MAG: response regulator [Verrucomicrobiota bacterium]
MTKKRILIIDDDAALTMAVRLNLEDTGRYEVMVENQSIHALNTAREFLPHLIILDVIMPGKDGGDVLAELKADRALKPVPVIMLTALVSKTDTNTGTVVESDEEVMLAKPVDLDVLIQCIEDRLAGQL